MPDKIGKYRIINEVGKGSTGAVYLSHDPFYGRDVAIKLYNAEIADEEDDKNGSARKMFFTEAQMVGRLQHPNILPIFDAGVEDDRYYVVMEHVHGARTLAAYCRVGNLLPVDETLRVVFTCARALHYAHTRGVIHRDIKPSNIILTLDNQVRVIDFGIALCADADVPRIDGIAGSPSYMSPEQIRSEEITARSDVYALGVLMYELLTGKRPFRASSLSKLLQTVIYATPAPIHQLRAEVTEELEELVMRALRKDPAERYASCLEFAAELTKAHQRLRSQEKDYDTEEHFGILRGLRFFHDFSYAEIRELMRAGEWMNYAADQEIVKQGDLDDRFYIVVTGHVKVVNSGKTVNILGAGECFGESAYVPGAARRASISADKNVTLLRVSRTMLETLSTNCQLRFNRVFVRTLISRLETGSSTKH